MKWLHKILALVLVKPFFKFFFKLRVSGVENLKDLSGPLLIITNHKFFLDSFAFGAAVPITTNIHPIRFMGETHHFNSVGLSILKSLGIVKFVYLIFGVFPAIRGEGLEKALAIPKKILKNKGVVFLHPEGKIVHGKEIGQFKRGAPALALATNVKILPAALKIKIESRGRRPKYFVKFGPTFKLPQNLTPEQGAEKMRNKVAMLYSKLYSKL